MNYFLLGLMAIWLWACQAQTEPATEKGTAPASLSPAIDTNLFKADKLGEQILAYKPEKRAEVSERDYKYGLMLLRETVSATKGEPENLNVSDYWNITMAFLSLGEPAPHVDLVFRAALAADLKTICVYADAMGTGNLAEVIPETYLLFEGKCAQLPVESKAFDLDEYCAKGGLDPALVSMMQAIQARDWQFRKQKPVDWSQQTPLDLYNQRLVDSLFAIHQSYLGNAKVGEQFASTMWAVIQHSNVDMMERYLPIVHQAYLDEELSVVALKLLIDRYYGLKHGYQVFGSQSGFGFEQADEATRANIMQTYQIE